MESIPHPFSPQYIPQPLTPSPFHTRSFVPERTATPAGLPERSGISLYLSTVSQQKEDPNAIIHDYYNVSPVSFSLGPDGSVPRTIEMPLVRPLDTLPTHVLAVLSSSYRSPGTKFIQFPPRSSDTLSSTHPMPDVPQIFDPYLIPISAELFFFVFGHDTACTLGAAALTSKWSKSPSPRIRADRTTRARLVSLPVIPLWVPHPPSLPHVLLFAQGIPLPTVTPAVGPSLSSSPLPSHPQSLPRSGVSALATYLLPLATIEEFPSAPAMAVAMARQCTPDALAARIAFNHGVWRNVLVLSPADATLVDLVRVAWNVTSEAVQLQQQQQQEHEPAVWLSAPPTRDRPAVKASAVASRTRTVAREVATEKDAKEGEGPSKVPDPPAPVAHRAATGLSPLRLPVVEVDYPVDFMANSANIPRAIPSAGKTFEKKCRSVQCLAPLESSLHGRTTQAVRL